MINDPPDEEWKESTGTGQMLRVGALQLMVTRMTDDGLTILSWFGHPTQSLVIPDAAWAEFVARINEIAPPADRT